jgi:hypothetical protein
MWLLALLPWFGSSTRKAAMLLWLSMVAWTCLVALNGQVRWQNERYSMPAVAWLLMSGALGTCWAVDKGTAALATLLRRGRSEPRTVGWVGVGAAALCAALAFAAIQRERFVGQLWFFGRASRNIFEQHVRAASLIRQSSATRVLVGDAGDADHQADWEHDDQAQAQGHDREHDARGQRDQQRDLEVQRLDGVPADERRLVALDEQDEQRAEERQRHERREQRPDVREQPPGALVARAELAVATGRRSSGRPSSWRRSSWWPAPGRAGRPRRITCRATKVCARRRSRRWRS